MRRPVNHTRVGVLQTVTDRVYYRVSLVVHRHISIRFAEVVVRIPRGILNAIDV